MLSLLAGNLWAVYNFDTPLARYQKFLARGPEALESLFDGLVLHDQVIVPTQDFLSLTVLRGALGPIAVDDLLDAGVLRFHRVKGHICYVGNGGGLKPFEILDKEKPDPFCGPIDEAIVWALAGPKRERVDQKLVDRVLSATVETELEGLVPEIKHETYTDILGDGGLRSLFATRSTEMDRLAGIGPDQVRSYGGPDVALSGDEIDTVLALAFANLEFRLVEASRATDFSTASPVGQLLKAKIQRAGAAETAHAVLRELTGVPNVCDAVRQGKLRVSALLRLHDSRAAREFRVWFHENAAKSPEDGQRAMIELLLSERRLQSTAAKVVRFLVTTGLGFIPGAGQILGTLAGAVDSFVVDRILQQRDPKIFIERMRQLK